MSLGSLRGVFMLFTQFSNLWLFSSIKDWFTHCCNCIMKTRYSYVIFLFNYYLWHEKEELIILHR